MPGTLIWTVAVLAQLFVASPAEAGVRQAHPDPTVDLHAQLETCKEGLLDQQARPEDRRRFATLLLSLPAPNRGSEVAALLGYASNLDVQRAVCGALLDRANRSNTNLDPVYIDPLLDLLGCEAGDLRLLSGQVLSRYRGVDVSGRLGEIAADQGMPLPKRIAAIGALTPNTHRRDVVGPLVQLLGSGQEEIIQRVVTELEPLTPEHFGADTQRWQAWWKRQSLLTEEAWLAAQLQIYRNRVRRIESDSRRTLITMQADRRTMAGKLRNFQRELHRLSGDQASDRLVTWLRDSLMDVQLTAISIIRSQMADEGERPTGPLLGALLALIDSAPSPVRVATLQIVQNLSDPLVIATVLAQLERETDPVNRHALFQALGKLNSPEAFPALIHEIASKNSPEICVREAALALGTVAGKRNDPKLLEQATLALKGRYTSTTPDQIELRAALLSAMAGVASPSFASEFLEAVESDHPAVLRAGVRGLRAIGDKSKLVQLRNLTEHADLLVRLEAIEAVGQLGQEEGDLERLLTRLNPAVESDAQAREAAWRGILHFWSVRPIEERIAAADRFRELPDREMQYLDQLASELSLNNGSSVHMITVLDRQAKLLVGLSRHAEACAPLQKLFDHLLDRSDPSVGQCASRLLEASLRGGSDTADLFKRLGTTLDDQAKAQLVNVLASYVDSPEVLHDETRSKALLTQMNTVAAKLFGEAWKRLIDKLNLRLKTDDRAEPPTSPP